MYAHNQRTVKPDRFDRKRYQETHAPQVPSIASRVARNSIELFFMPAPPISRDSQQR
jgi:hypothetical protein